MKIGKQPKLNDQIFVISIFIIKLLKNSYDLGFLNSNYKLMNLIFYKKNDSIVDFINDSRFYKKNSLFCSNGVFC